MSSQSHHKRRGGAGGWRGRGGHRKAQFVEDKQRGKRTGQAEGDVDENCPVLKAFRSYQVEMDAKNDRFERIMKLNRDITIESKRLIFLLQRVNRSEDAASLMLEAEEKMKELYGTKFLPLAKELEGQDVYQFLKAFTGGLQEYIEAVTFYQYLASQKLACVESIQSQLVFTCEDQKGKEENVSSEPSQTSIVEKMTDLATTDSATAQTCEHTDKVESPSASSNRPTCQPEESEAGTNQTVATSHGQSDGKVQVCVPVPQSEYMLGVADFTGELMRLAINSVGAGDLETPKVIADMMRTIHNAFSTFSNTTREMRRKANVLRQSLAKVERACYTLQVRGSEIPKHMLADVFSSSAAPDSFVSEDTEDLFD